MQKTIYEIFVFSYTSKQNDIHDNHNSNKGCSRFELPRMFLVTFAVYSKVNSRYFVFT